MYGDAEPLISAELRSALKAANKHAGQRISMRVGNALNSARAEDLDGPHVSGEPAVPVPTGLVAAQNARIWMVDVLIGIEPTPAPIGGSVRFASSEARSRSVTLRRGCQSACRFWRCYLASSAGQWARRRKLSRQRRATAPARWGGSASR